jgi:N-dimethylarginine dimethylaminohydrolase
LNNYENNIFLLFIINYNNILIMSILLGNCNKNTDTFKLSCKEKQLVLKRISRAFKKYNIDVQRVETDKNQVLWIRDIYIPIDNTYVIGNLTKKSTMNNNRINEFKELENILHKSVNIIKPPRNVKLEGGDIIQYNDYIFVGNNKRTNKEGYEYLKNTFKNKKVILVEHTAVHLDCVFCILESGVIFYDSKYIKKLKIPKKIQDKEKFIINDISSIVDSGKFLATNFVQIPNTKTLIISNIKENKLFRDILENMGYNLEIVKTENIYLEGGSIRCLTQWLIN